MTNVFTRTWARVEAGVIVELQTIAHNLVHPFELLENQVAVDVTKVPAAIGDLVDSKGNVATNPGRTVPLAPHEPAYHDRSATPALTTAELAAKVSTSTPLDLEDKRAQEDAAWASHEASTSPKSPATPADPAAPAAAVEPAPAADPAPSGKEKAAKAA